MPVITKVLVKVQLTLDSNIKARPLKQGSRLEENVHVLLMK